MNDLEPAGLLIEEEEMVETEPEPLPPVEPVAVKVMKPIMTRYTFLDMLLAGE